MQQTYLPAPDRFAGNRRIVGRLFVASVILLVLVLAFWWNGQHIDQGAPTLPAWAQLNPDRYPCPAGQSRQYTRGATGIWRADCSEGQP